jgi:hypothetical protein
MPKNEFRWFFVPAISILLSMTSAADASSSFNIPMRAVHIQLDLPERASTIHGTGAWLDTNTILTVSHLFPDDLRKDETFSIDIIASGEKKPAKIRHGNHPSELDFAVLDIIPITDSKPREERTRLSFCSDPLRAGQPVIVAAAAKDGSPIIIHSYGSNDSVSSYKGKQSSHAITAFLPPGVSGASVFDEESGCLLGTITQQSSQETTVKDLTYEIFTTVIVPIADIADAMKSLTEE